MTQGTHSSTRLLVAVLSLTSAVWTGCSSGNGGSTNTGGKPGASGGAIGTGGTITSGGVSGTGGVTGTGGVVGTGGTSDSGGVTGSGGATSTGGATGTGGGGTGGRADGGVPGTGGAGAPDGGDTAAVTANPSRVAISGVRGLANPAATQTIQLRNGGTTPVQLTQLTLGGTNATIFTITSPAQFPATIMPGGNLAVTLRMDTVFSQPAAPSNKDMGVTFLTASMTAALSTGTLQIPVYGLVAAMSNYEATFGQILTVLGYKMNVGKPQNNWNWNNGNPPTSLGGVEAGTDEVAAQLFVKAGTGDVTMVPVARFSPEGAEQFGWYRPGMSTMRTTVGMMSMGSTAQTSNGARTMYPPTSGGTTFDPGTTPFGLFASTSPGDATAVQTHGTMDFSQDSLNTPANVHRVKAFTLKDATGTAVPNSFLLGFEEAANGDYQDYVFMLSNVKPSP